MAATLIQCGLDGTLISSLPDGLWQITPHLTGLAQTYQDNLGANLQGSWDNFIQSGQVWALLIGFVVGYVFRSMTSY
ncbi:MAG: hypothetical protein ACFCU8_05810 [Thermosynechococcaceae cyanobacterium]